MGEFILNLEQLLITYSPNIISIIGMIVTFIVSVKKLNDGNDELKTTKTKLEIDMAKYKEDIERQVKQQAVTCNKLLIENLELKEQNRELKILLTKVDSGASTSVDKRTVGLPSKKAEVDNGK